MMHLRSNVSLLNLIAPLSPTERVEISGIHVCAASAEIHARQFTGARRRPFDRNRGTHELSIVPVFRLRRSHSLHAIAIFDNRRIVIDRGSAAPRCDGHVCAHVQSEPVIFPPV